MTARRASCDAAALLELASSARSVALMYERQARAALRVSTADALRLAHFARDAWARATLYMLLWALATD